MAEQRVRPRCPGHGSPRETRGPAAGSTGGTRSGERMDPRSSASRRWAWREMTVKGAVVARGAASNKDVPERLAVTSSAGERRRVVEGSADTTNDRLGSAMVNAITLARAASPSRDRLALHPLPLGDLVTPLCRSQPAPIRAPFGRSPMRTTVGTDSQVISCFRTFLPNVVSSMEFVHARCPG